MGVSRVDFDGETLVDLTGDTVTPQSLLIGYTAHNKAGELIEGLVVVPKKVSELENDRKYITETGDSSKTTVTFEQAVKRANVNSGDDLSTAFSKLSKFCNDLKPHAFSAPSSDLLTTVPGFSLDATIGKKLKDLHDANKNEINALSGNLFDSGWRILNTEWNCRYRVKSGVVYVFINTNLPSLPETGRKLLGTIPLQNYGFTTLRYTTIMPTDGARGFLMLNSDGGVLFEVSTPNRWNYGLVLGIAD